MYDILLLNRSCISIDPRDEVANRLWEAISLGICWYVTVAGEAPVCVEGRDISPSVMFWMVHDVLDLGTDIADHL
jgi:hypothetical protein